MTHSVKCVYLLSFICAYFLKREFKPKVLVGRASMRFEPGGVGDSESDQHQGARRKTWQGRKKSWRGICHNLRGKFRGKSIRGGTKLLIIVFSLDSTWISLVCRLHKYECILREIFQEFQKELDHEALGMSDPCGTLPWPLNPMQCPGLTVSFPTFTFVLIDLLSLVKW